VGFSGDTAGRLGTRVSRPRSFEEFETGRALEAPAMRRKAKG
jgi:hypothetical protein